MQEQATSPSDQARQAGLNLLKLPLECLRPFEADRLRRTERTAEREIEHLRAHLRRQGQDPWIPIKLRDYSLSGFGVHYQRGSDQAEPPLPGEAVELRLDGPWPEPLSVPCEIRNVQLVGGGLRLGLVRTDVLESGSPVDATGLALGSSQRIAAQVGNAILFNEWSEATLARIRGAGEWEFESGDPGLLLIRGAPLEVFLDLPLEDAAACQGTVLWIRRLDDDKVRFGVAWTRMGHAVSNGLGEHLLRGQSCKPQDLHSIGLFVRKFRDEIEFRFASTREEYADVLNLRNNAYRLAGKLESTNTPESLASPLDRRTRFLTAYHGDLLIASVSLTFADKGDKLRSEGEFPGGEYPVPMPDRTRMIELHSLCTHKEYRGGDLVRSLIEQCARVLLLSDRDWFVTFITGELLPLYRRIGFREAGARAEIRSLGGIEHHLVVVHRDAFLCGKAVSPTTWNHFFGEMVNDLREKGFVALSRFGRIRHALYSMLAPFTRRWFRKSLEREFQAFLQTCARKGDDCD